jgi:hypothetical protein
MSGPSTFDGLLEWWFTGRISRGEFFGYLLPLLNDTNVEHIMSNIPAPLKSKVPDWAKSLCHAYRRGETVLQFGNGPIPDDTAMEALCKWLDRQVDQDSPDPDI